MFKIKQITPSLILENKEQLEEFFKEEFDSLKSEGSWITDWLTQCLK